MVFSYQLDRRRFATWMAGTGALAFLGCSSKDDDQTPAVDRPPVELPALGSVILTTERTIVPIRPRSAQLDERSPIDPEGRAALLADGYGDYDYGPGEPIIARMPDGSVPPASGTNRKVLTRFVHVTDIHVTDDESPIRLATFDGPSPFGGAARPHSSHMGRVLNATVRTVNALNRQQPIDFLLLGGDSTDSAQRNELQWVVSILSGTSVVACDSGETNDPIPGSDNDPKDPFMPEGLDIPWKFCLGNHDTEIMGLTAITQVGIDTATGDYSRSGTQDWSQPGGPVITGEVPADENRRPLYRHELVEIVAADGDGHGLRDLPTNKVSYVFDVEGTPLRFVVYDTPLEEGGADGIVRRPDLEAFIKPALDQAKSENKWVILVSHHGLDSLGDGGYGTKEAKAQAVLPEEVKEFFLSYDNIMLSITGHTHDHVVSWVDGDDGGFWEVQTCALIAFPSQARLVEIADEDNGYLSIQLIGVDYATEGDVIAEEGRRLLIVDHTSGWGGGDMGTPEDRNVKLYVPISTP